MTGNKKTHEAILSRVGLRDSVELFLAAYPAPPTQKIDSLTEQRSETIDNDLNLPAPSLEQYSIYGEEWCGFTQRAQALLKQLKLPYQYNNLGNERAQFARRYAEGYRTMPMVFHKGQFIGGFEQLKNSL